MLVIEAMNKNVEIATGDTNVRMLAKQMSARRIGAVVIISNSGSIEGIVTERDIMSKVVAEARDVESVTASEIMQTEVITVGPSQQLEDAAELMTKNDIKKLPVIQNGKLIGIITASDLIAYEEKLVEKVAQLMTTTRISGIGG